MGTSVIVLGESGSGKSTSLRNFEPNELGILNVMGKPLPFRKKLDTMNAPTYADILKCVASGKRKAWVIDDAGYLMQNENFGRAKEKGYDKFVEIALHFQQLFIAVRDAPADTIVYFFMHPELDQFGNTRIKTVGKMIDEKFNLAGAVPILIEAKVQDGQYVFVTKNDGTNLAKAPMEMLEPVMPNDLKAVDTAIRDYWGLAPLGGDSNANKSQK